MTRAFVCFTWLVFTSSAAFAQSEDPAARFEFADVHVSAKVQNPFMRTMPPRGDRFEIRTATMVDLIRTAYGFDADKVVGGPSWIEMDRFDVIAKVPADVPPETRKLMQQALLADRFKLVIHKENRPLPTFALVVGKKPQLKEADGTGDTGCRIPSAPASAPGEGTGYMMMTMNTNGAATTFSLGPGMTVQYVCRNITLAAFAEGLRGMMGAAGTLGPNPILDETGLKGSWNFDVKWSLQMSGVPREITADRITVFDAVEKQLGLKLETRQAPTPVIVVDSVNRKPSENPPGTAEALPVIMPPAEFEVADIKPTDPALRMIRFQIQPGGRVTVQGMPLRSLLARAFNTTNNDQIVGAPKWTDTERFDITAKAPSAAQLDMESVAPMMHALLVDRFNLASHNEERQLPAYSLVAGKPKMKKADPASRTYCRYGAAPLNAPPGARTLTCQNITMREFAEQLLYMGPGLNWPVLDATGIEGGWDFALTFSQMFMATGVRGPGEGGPAAANGALPDAAEPSGTVTIFEAVEKQLGLKLELQKRSLPVYVIDHIEQKPTDN
ncbi:MAG: TIGR03435 family protein [Terriglobia bacterium]